MKSLLSILLWCLYPLSPALRLYELTRHALRETLRCLSDERWIEWLLQDPDDPQGIARFERWIANMNAGIDLLVYLRAREMLGLPNHEWNAPREAPLQSRKSRSFEELWSSLEACILKFGDIERLAARRAQRLQRAASALPQSAQAPPTTTTTTIAPRTTPAAPLPTTTTIVSTGRAGLRVRAPPWRLATPYSPLPTPHSLEAQLPRPRPFMLLAITCSGVMPQCENRFTGLSHAGGTAVHNARETNFR